MNDERLLSEPVPNSERIAQAESILRGRHGISVTEAEELLAAMAAALGESPVRTALQIIDARWVPKMP